jgi:hypothetical protein
MEEQYQMYHTNDTYISTSIGAKVPVFDMLPHHVSLQDIAHALSMKCRFTGHTSQFYSVAEHSCNVLWEALAKFPAMSAKMKFHLLFHDAPEAYLPDFAAPIKYAAHWVVSRGGKPTVISAEQLESEVFATICKRFGVAPLDPLTEPIVKEFDRKAASTEAYHLMGGTQWPLFPEASPVVPACWTPFEAENTFMRSACVILEELQSENGATH